MSIPDNLQMNKIDLHDNENTGTKDFTNSEVHGDPERTVSAGIQLETPLER